ncbi:damage-inducible protein DinB [Chitinophaga horti]|uniref:Damage-inducible protein DinB n=1 Tax=Chitinophaga horti TaxID=2920382 RepID=A0ABY6J5R4_9BACT|nr:DinB family protein [Chitinophaga horti]UYQ93629.1 damage-inducible protein DinB [Chitinophaga horti]
MIQEIPTPAVAQASIATAMKNYANYNFWAASTLVKWLRTKPAYLLEQEVASSFPSIRSTLVHMWQTQCYWLAMIKREAPFIPEEFTGDILEAIVDQSEELAYYIDSLDTEDIEASNLVVNPWFECDFQNFEYIIQVVNHSTYHRGQVISIGRQLGFTDAPMTDYNFYNVYGK